MKPIIFLLLIVAAITSCTPATKNQVALFNNINFNLQANEQEVEVYDTITNIYFSNFNEDAFRIPLFRYIEAKDYQVFIGIPYGTNIGRLTASQLIGSDSTLIDAKQDTAFFYQKHQVNGRYITQYAASYQKNIVYLLAVTESKNLSDSLFGYEGLSKRIK